MKSNFIHLHNHSDFSMLDGAIKAADLVEAAVAHKMPAVALTDHGNIFGAVNFSQQAKEKGVKPILGCEVYVAPKGRKRKKPIPHGPAHYHLLLLVKDEIGYRNLCQLITKSYLEGFYYRPRVDKELLEQYGKGLIASSACLKGELSYLLAQGLESEAEEAALEYASFFSKGDFYIEIQDHGLEPQKRVNPLLVRLAKKLRLPLVATNDIHYLHKEDADSHDVLLCIQTNKKVSDKERIRFGSKEFYFKSEVEMEGLFKDLPEAIASTADISAKCNFDISTSGYFLPQFEVAPGVSLSDYFSDVVKAGFRERLRTLKTRMDRKEISSIEEYEKRLEKEIQLVKEMGFDGYFLIVWDLIREAKTRDIPVGPGRGSAAGSLLAYSLGITAIDPLEYDLLFERFLNPERISLPDIDIDFCGRRRDEIIDYATRKYGRDNVCQIITFGTMAARQAIRDVGRALEIPLPEVDKIAKMIPPFGEDACIAGASERLPQLKDIKERNPEIAKLLEVAQKLEGQIRHPSIHAAGIVITPRPLVEFMPLYQSVHKEITTQFPMQDVEAIGLLKMDILGLRNLTVIQDAVGLIKNANGQEVDVSKIPLDDKETFQIFLRGNTDGVFQFESSGMKDLLRRFKPENFRDLIALNALYRPGPLQSGMTEDFIRCKSHPERVKYDIPQLEPILKETQGLIVYQEQVMRIATDIAGFSMAEADLLRKAMGKKKSSVMKAQKRRFVEGARERGIISSDAIKLFEKIKHFAGYGFNKSHSAAYAYLAYQTAYLKAHFPVYFMAALLTSEAERGATPQVAKYINECRNMGIKVLPPDINKSEVHFSVEDEGIRFGLSAIKNVGEGAIRAIIEARNKQERFSSPFEICREVGTKAFNRKVIESLIKAGAMDCFGWNRSQLYRLVDEMIEYSQDFHRIESSNQAALFSQSQMEPLPFSSEVKELEEWEEPLCLTYEKEVLGFYITGHPLSQYKKSLKNLVSHSIDKLGDTTNSGHEVSLAGIISSLRLLKTRKDERMATFVLEDMTGRIEVITFPESYKRYYEHLREDLLVWIKGRFQGNEEGMRVQLEEVMPLTKALEEKAKRMILRLNLPGLKRSTIEELKSLMSANLGKCPVLFELKANSFTVVVQSIEIQGVVLSESLRRKIEALLGERSVLIQY